MILSWFSLVLIFAPLLYVEAAHANRTECIRIHDQSIGCEKNQECKKSDPQGLDPRGYCVPRGFPVRCEPPFVEFGERQRCLSYEYDALHYDEAHKKCLDKGAALAAIEEGMPGLDKLRDFIIEHHQQISINWSVWVVKEHPTDDETKWDKHCFSFMEFPWTPCPGHVFNRMNFFCEQYKYNPCGDESWFYRDSQCFKAITRPEGYTFWEAKDECAEEHGAILATIDSRSKNELTIKLLKESGVIPRSIELQDAWIGLRLYRFSDPAISDYAEWQDGEIDDYYLQEDHRGKYPWAPGEPNHEDEFCVQVNTDQDKALWNDRNCGEKLKAAICSRPYAYAPEELLQNCVKMFVRK
ncbi:lectin c-type domain-containing protein [Ditylenchus destructor]|nr:lectin c-type domain-containing protein [Ditylenchus destructor]